MNREIATEMIAQLLVFLGRPDNAVDAPVENERNQPQPHVGNVNGDALLAQQIAQVEQNPALMQLAPAHPWVRPDAHIVPTMQVLPLPRPAAMHAVSDAVQYPAYHAQSLPSGLMFTSNPAAAYPSMPPLGMPAAAFTQAHVTAQQPPNINMAPSSLERLANTNGLSPAHAPSMPALVGGDTDKVWQTNGVGFVRPRALNPQVWDDECTGKRQAETFLYDCEQYALDTNTSPVVALTRSLKGAVRDRWQVELNAARDACVELTWPEASLAFRKLN